MQRVLFLGIVLGLLAGVRAEEIDFLNAVREGEFRRIVTHGNQPHCLFSWVAR